MPVGRVVIIGKIGRPAPVGAAKVLSALSCHKLYAALEAVSRVVSNFNHHNPNMTGAISLSTMLGKELILHIRAVSRQLKVGQGLI
jgi:hypothetical protein